MPALALQAPASVARAWFVPAAFAVPMVLLMTGCTRPAPTTASRATAAAVTNCRASTDQSFNRQNRYLLSERDTTDSPFSNSGDSGITTRGLTQRYDYGTALESCLAASRVPNPAGSPATSIQPAARLGTTNVQPF